VISLNLYVSLSQLALSLSKACSEPVEEGRLTNNILVTGHSFVTLRLTLSVTKKKVVTHRLSLSVTKK